MNSNVLVVIYTEDISAVILDFKVGVVLVEIKDNVFSLFVYLESVRSFYLSRT